MGETTMNATQTVRRFAVLNCSVTQVLGRHASYEHAAYQAAQEGNCSFVYELSAEELATAQDEGTTPIEPQYDAVGNMTLAIGEVNAEGVAPLVLVQCPEAPKTAELWEYDETEPAQTRHRGTFTIAGDQGSDPWDIAREAAAKYL